MDDSIVHSDETQFVVDEVSTIIKEGECQNELDISNKDDDDEIKLSAHTLTALREFYAEQQITSSDNASIQEDWQLSQFWYDDNTANVLSNEAIRLAGSAGSIACISCPTIYKRLQEIKPISCNCKLFEYDTRFSIYGNDFVFYDYKEPSNEALEKFKGSFDIVIADPPFLSEECLTKISKTIQAFAKDKIILCTGATMETLALKLLGVHACQFEPKHARNLGNKFKCFANYDLDSHLIKD